MASTTRASEHGSHCEVQQGGCEIISKTSLVLLQPFGIWNIQYYFLWDIFAPAPHPLGFPLMLSLAGLLSLYVSHFHASTWRRLSSIDDDENATGLNQATWLCHAMPRICETWPFLIDFLLILWWSINRNHDNSDYIILHIHDFFYCHHHDQHDLHRQRKLRYWSLWFGWWSRALKSLVKASITP